ncbi:hypothetical protein HDU67_001206 [Dinochytrium kinnereticum]|nr:hypothetical protein HDU67_001206 [Dinochytrium kinnereticum]
MPLYTGKESWTAFKSDMEKELASSDRENFFTTVPIKADASHAEHKKALQTLIKHCEVFNKLHKKALRENV